LKRKKKKQFYFRQKITNEAIILTPILNSKSNSLKKNCFLDSFSKMLKTLVFKVSQSPT
jgi:hypothetical protein